MEVLTYSVAKNAIERRELRINTVTLSLNKSEKVGLFRCVFCGEAIVQYRGDVKKISPGVEPYGQALIINRCHNQSCGALYTFQTHKDTNDKTKVLLSMYPVLSGYQFFFCYVCRQPILKYTNGQAKNLQTMINVSLPYEYKCHTASCHANYLFSEVL